MALGLLGNKIKMTQIFDVHGNTLPVTIIKAGPCYVTQIKSIKDCGYNAIQLGYSELELNSKALTKAELGHFSSKNLVPFKYLREFYTNKIESYQIGQKYTTELFTIGQKVNITSTSIGKGNAGNIKKNNFSRGPMSHGSKHHRLQGSIGAGTTPGRVLPGKKMPGRLGGKKCTINNLTIIDIITEENLIIIKGSIPGKLGNLITIKLKE